MKKSRFDNRSCTEIVGLLVSERTSQGDLVIMTVKYNGDDKPDVVLDFQTTDPDKKRSKTTENITDWLEDKPYYQILDDVTGKPITGARKGSNSWPEYVDNQLGPAIQSITKAGGRIFTFQVDSGVV